MLKVEKLVVGALKTNCYLVYDEQTFETAIIDPGDDADYIINKISDLELKPIMILGTHGHYDHLLAVNEIKLAYKIPFLMHKDDEKMFSWYRKSAVRFSGFDPGPAPKIDKYIKATDEIIIGKNKIVVIDTPGHTPGGISLYSKSSKLVFSGDTLFAVGAVGRTDFPYSDLESLLVSVQLLLKLPLQTTIYSGHGRATTVAEALTFSHE